MRISLITVNYSFFEVSPASKLLSILRLIIFAAVMNTSSIIVKGRTVDSETRCVHYKSPLDIIAIKFKCCSTYYACYECHAEESGHTAKRWGTNELDTKAVLCGNCKNEMTIRQYIGSGNKCP